MILPMEEICFKYLVTLGTDSELSEQQQKLDEAVLVNDGENSYFKKPNCDLDAEFVKIFEEEISSQTNIFRINEGVKK